MHSRSCMPPSSRHPSLNGHCSVRNEEQRFGSNQAHWSRIGSCDCLPRFFQSRTVQVGIGVGQGGARGEVTYGISSANIPKMKLSETLGTRVLCRFTQSNPSTERQMHDRSKRGRIRQCDRHALLPIKVSSSSERIAIQHAATLILDHSGTSTLNPYPATIPLFETKYAVRTIPQGSG